MMSRTRMMILVLMLLTAATWAACGRQAEPVPAGTSEAGGGAAAESTQTPPTPSGEAGAAAPPPTGAAPPSHAPGAAHEAPPSGAPPAPAAAAGDTGAAEPPAPPAATARTITVREGKRLRITLDGPVSTATAQVGDPFAATLIKDVMVGAEGQATLAVRKGAKVHGQVIEVEAAKRVKGLAKLVLRFDEIVLPDGTRAPIQASLVSEAESTKKRDTATIAGGAAAGAILGKIMGGEGKDAVVGAIVGGAIGTGVVMGTKGKEVELPAGTELRIELDQAVEVPAPTPAA